MIASTQHSILPDAIPAAVVAMIAAGVLAAYVLLRGRKLISSRYNKVLRPLLGVVLCMAAILAIFELLQRYLVLATPWPLWPIALVGAAAIEALLTLYRLERQTLPAKSGWTLAALRIAAAALVILMLAQPVRTIDLSRHIQRTVAVLVDISASMNVRDTELTASQKVRIAEALYQGPQRQWRLELSADAIAKSQSQLQQKIFLVEAMTAMKADQRQQHLDSMRAELERAVLEVRDALVSQAEILDAHQGDPRLANQELRSSLMDIKARTGSRVMDSLAAALKILDAKSSAGLGVSQEALLASLVQAASELTRVRESMHALAKRLDEQFYANLSPADRSAVDAAAGKSRYQQACQALLCSGPSSSPQPQSLLDALGAKYQLRLYTFDSSAERADINIWRQSARALQSSPAATQAASAPSAQAGAEGTDLAAALDKVASDLATQEIAGVVLLSDGRQAAKSPLEAGLRQLGLLQAPICAIAVGCDNSPMDASIAAVEASETVNIRDKLQVDAQVKFEGLAGRSVKVSLYDGQELKDSKTISVAGQSLRQHVSLSDTPQRLGVHAYRVEVDAVEGEAFAANNSYPLTVNVTEDRLRLLLIESRPRWEFRYLKNLFASRDETVRLQYVLFEPDQIQGQPTAAPVAASVAAPPDQVQATALPVDEAAWMKFDVIILGDVSPSRFTPAQLECIRKFVVERGGTLVVIAGSSHMPHAYNDSILAQLLPVVSTQGGAEQGDNPFRLSVAREAASHVIMRQATEESQNQQIWASFPQFFWRCPLRAVKAGATILAFADDGSIRPQAASGPADNSAEQLRLQNEYERRNAIIVVQSVAMGQVMFLGIDETWRMRYRVGDRHHHKFWGQVLRWAKATKLPAGTSLVKLGTDRARYAPGSSVQARARILNPDFSPFVTKDVAVKVFSGQQMVLRKLLSYRGDLPGMYSADLGPLPSGSYRIELDAPSVKPLLEQEKAQGVSTDFSVDPSTPVELIELSADRSSLAKLANLTGGIVAELDQGQRVLEALGEPVLVSRQIRQYSLWDSAWMLGAIILLLTAEWLLRKKAGLA